MRLTVSIPPSTGQLKERLENQSVRDMPVGVNHVPRTPS